MTLNASGPISLGGSTSGQSVNLELGQSATAQISFNDANVRTLTATTAGTALVMPTNFYGKSNSETQTVTAGEYDDGFGNITRGYSQNLGIGSINDGTFGLISNATIKNLISETGGSTIIFEIIGTYPNSGFTSMVLAGITYTRASAFYVASGGTTYWSWGGGNDPFSPNGTVRAAVFNP